MDPGMDGNFMDMLQDMLPKRTKRRTVTVAEARRILLQDELDKLVNMDEVVDEAEAVGLLEEEVSVVAVEEVVVCFFASQNCMFFADLMLNL